MLRAIAVIAAAIGLVNPTMSKPQRTAYARTIRASAAKYDIDPFTLVAIGWHESNFRPGAVSPDGEDHGLMQVRARYELGCRNDADPVHNPSASCKAAKVRLLDGHVNIRRAAAEIDAWRKLCRKRTKRPALFHRWLHGLGGMGHPSRGIICGQKKVKVCKGKGRRRKCRQVWRDLPIRRQLREIIDCRRSLIRGQRCHRARRASRKR